MGCLLEIGVLVVRWEGMWWLISNGEVVVVIGCWGGVNVGCGVYGGG